MADDKWQMADDKCQMANDEMANGRWQVPCGIANRAVLT